jgi:CO dehydrogenase/acetyl-CoA synthase beta subunit
MIRTRQTVYMEVIAKEITIIKISGEISMETALEEVVSRVVNLIINMIYYHCSLNKRSTIYIKSLNAS